jgi:hypothetical protein
MHVGLLNGIFFTTGRDSWLDIADAKKEEAEEEACKSI